MTSRVNQQIGSYRLVKWVGKGGTGEVYLGVHVATGAQVAVKVMFDELAANDVQSFRREANIIARLHHPNIVNVLEYGLDGLVPYLVLTYAPNGTLRTRYPKGQPVRLDTLLPDIRQIADALHYVHDQHLVHRDIKPANLLIGAGNEILLGDFGIAIIAQTTGSLNTQQVAGTIDYMAPEQLAGKARPASDQYSLATIVYELLAGRLPFQGTPQEIIGQKQCGPALPLRATAPHLPRNVQAVVMKALHQDPGQRFGSVAEFVTELEAAQRSPIYQAAGAPDPADATVRGVLDPAAARKKRWDGRLVPAWQWLQGLFTGATPPALPGKITWASLGLTQRFWFPRVCWNLSPLFFAADLLLPTLAAGLWWHSWPVLLAALLVPLLALAVCGLGQDGGRRPLALVGAALCGLLWGWVGYALGTAIQNASAALAFGTLAGVVGTELHIAAFPCRSVPIDRGRERRSWRWWLLCAVNMLALPLLLGAALRSPNAFALSASGAALLCVLGMLGDARNRPALWGLATLLLVGFWSLVGWTLGANAHTGGFAWGPATIPWAAPGLAVLGLVLGMLAHRALFFARPLPRPGFSRPLLPFSGLSGKQRFWLLVLLVVDLLSLPLALGLWFKSLALAGALAVGGLLLLVVMRRGYALHKKLPVVFGTFLTSLVWGLIGWLLGLFLGQQAHLKVFTLALSGQVVAGTWLSLLLGLMGVCFSPARHLALLYPAPKGITQRRDKLHTRIWLLCALDTLALPLVLLLALPGAWTFGVAASGALLLLVTAVCADVWEERGLRALAVLAGLGFWGLCGWLGGLLVPGLPEVSVTLGEQIVQGTWLSLALALLALGLGCWLHASVFSRWNK